MTQEEKSQHAQRLTDAVDKLKKSSSKSIRCGGTQDQTQAAASQSRRKKMYASGDPGNLKADLALLWSRKYQPSNMSEVTLEHICQLPAADSQP